MKPTSNKIGIWAGRILSAMFLAGAIVFGLVVIYHTDYYPRTDDAEIMANYIGIAPQIEGPLVRLDVQDNQFVKKGDLLFEIDDRPYRYALQKAVSDQATLEGQVSDERRRIAALISGVSVAEANIHGTEADVNRWAAAVNQARADVANAEDAVSRERAEWIYANNNLHRIEPLLVKQFVTADQVDRARTSEISQAQSLKQSESQLLQAEAGLDATLAQEQRSKAMLAQSKAQHEQTQHAVTTLDPLVNQRGAKASAIILRAITSATAGCTPLLKRASRTSRLRRARMPTPASGCSLSLTRARGGQSPISAKDNCSASLRGCERTFMSCPGRTSAWQVWWTASDLA